MYVCIMDIVLLKLIMLAIDEERTPLWPLLVAIIAALLVACVLVFIIVMVRCRGQFDSMHIS